MAMSTEQSDDQGLKLMRSNNFLCFYSLLLLQGRPKRVRPEVNRRDWNIYVSLPRDSCKLRSICMCVCNRCIYVYVHV